MIRCNECTPTGSLEDIIYNPECPNCDGCWCTSCKAFYYSSKESSNICPFDNPCEDCGHINPPDECFNWPGVGIKRKLEKENEDEI